MVTSPYFKKFGESNELSLQEDLFIEFVQIRGIDVVYLPKVYLTEDCILNEVVDHYHSEGICIEMLLEDYEDWEANSIDMNSFGLAPMANQATFVVSKRRFCDMVSEHRLQIGTRPNEGDVIYSPDLQQMFVIKKVNIADPTKTNDRWTLKVEKLDNDDNVNIDLRNVFEEAKSQDPAFDNGNPSPFADSIEDFLERDFADIDPDMSAEDIDANMEKETLDAAINKENPNQKLIDIAEGEIYDD